MATLVGIVIVVSGLVFGTSLLGTLSLNAFLNWSNVKNLTCNCKIDLDADVYPWQISVGKMAVDFSVDKPNVSIEKLELDTHLCGGALINTKWAIIGAHCVRFNFDQNLGAGFGSGDLLAIYNKRRIPIRQIVFNSTNRIDDIALIELEKEIDFSAEPLVRPACFNRFNEKREDFGYNLIATGWNLVEKSFLNKDYFSLSRYHNQVKFKDVSLEDKNCDNRNKICVRSKSVDSKFSCYPDTSAPLHNTVPSDCLTTIVGIHQISSHQEMNNQTGCPTIYFTRLNPKIEFIRSIVKDQICLV